MTQKTITVFCSISILLSSLLFAADPLFAQQKTGNVTMEAVSVLEQGRAYHNRGDYRKAIEEYDRFINLVPGRADAHYRRGMAYDNLGDFNRAMQDYNRAIEINPKLVEAYNNRGAVYDNLGDLNRAIKDYNNAIKLRPGFAEAYNIIGELPISSLATWKKV